MAKLDKLQICGIRSFNPDHDESIKFSSPLTLLMGENGCGKTTIIEALKYALTGALPAGTSNGQGFVNDPNMCKKHSTKGCIKLRFRDASGRTVTVGRFMSVTKKGDNKLTFSSMAPSIRVQRGDEEVDVSGRCLDIDEFCSQALNVAPSILNNVLFCHQENSFWPLDEPIKLKAKFDEIFDSVKYNECSKNLRALYATYNKKVKEIRKDLVYLKENVERTQNKRDQLNIKQTKLAEQIKSIESKKEALVPLDARMTEILELENELGRLQQELAKYNGKKVSAIENQNSIRKNILKVFEGSDEELQEKINSFEKECRVLENSLKQATRKKDEIENKLGKIVVEKDKSQVNIGKLQEEKNQFDKIINESSGLIIQARQKLNLTSKSNETDLNQRQSILIELNTALSKSVKSFNELVSEKDSQIKDLQKSVDSKREQFLESKHTVETKLKEIKTNETKIRELAKKISSLQSNLEPMKRMEKKQEVLEENLKKVREDFNEAQNLKQIDINEKEINQLDLEISDLEQQYKLLVENQITEEKIELEQEAIQNKQCQIMEIKYKHTSLLSRLFNNKIPEKNYKENIAALMQKGEQALKQGKSKTEGKQREVTTLETTLKHKKSEVEKMENDLKSKESSIITITKGKSFTEVLETSYRKKEKLQRDKGQYTSGKVIYEQFITKFQEADPCCPICETSFKNKLSEINRIISKLKRTTDRIPSSLEKVNRELEEEETFYNKLQQLEPVHQQIDSLKNDLQKATAELKQLQESHSAALKQLKDYRNEMEINEELVKSCRSLISDATLLDQYLSDIENSQSNLNKLQSHRESSLLENKSKQQVEIELDNKKAKTKDLKNSVNSLRKLVDNNRKRTHDLAMEIQSVAQKILDFKNQCNEKPILEQQKSELEQINRELQDEINLISAEKGQYEKELNKSEREKEAVEEQNRILIEESRSKVDKLKEIVNHIAKMQVEIDRYRQNNIEEKLNNATEKGQRIEEELKNATDEKNKILDEISSIKDKQAQEQNNFRCYQDNLSLRRNQKEAMELDEKIKNLEKKIGDHNYKSVYQEKKVLAEKIKVTNNEINTISGQKTEMENTIKEIETELKRPEHKNASTDYRNKAYEKAITDVIIKDLGKYINALDTSIMQFHKERMEQINKIIRELWVNIYRGNDIEYIEIQTEVAANTSANRRSYNYKVMQVKSGVSLDMRGRCSAGQKVLACMIIRMALAEAFSTTCGILTLDEPTTNLDQANIKSLSLALANIIKTREHEKNFQLIIISHDEDFLREINHNDNISLVWKVERDDQGFSVIKNFNL